MKLFEGVKFTRTVSTSYLIMVVAISFLNFYPQAASAQEQNSNSTEQTIPDGKRIWNLENVDLLALIGEISRITGRNFIIDPRVTGKASLVSNEPMDNKQAYQAFLSILQVLGFTAIDSGPVTKIVPTSVAKQLDTKINAKNLTDLGDEMVVQVIPVKHVTATALIPILRSLVNQQGHLAPYPPSNVIVVADHAKNVARIKEIIKRIDQESNEEVEIITLKDASAEEVVKVLNNLISKNQQIGESVAQQVKMAADLRTNSILLSGDKTKRLKMRALIAQMDVPTPRTGDTEVIYLKYQTAEDLVPVVSSVISAYYGEKEGRSDSGFGRSNASAAGGSHRARSSTGGADTTTNSSEHSMESTVEFANNKRGQDGSLSAPGVRAEPNTNSLVITAPQELMRNIKSVISQLDIRRYQVLVEALIVEVSLEHILALGIEWRLPNHTQGSGGGTNFGLPTSSTDTNGIINAQNASIPLLRNLVLSGMTVGFLRSGDIRAIIQALGQDINTNILSTPTLVTMDNETAEIVVADKIPFKTSAKTNNASDANSIINSYKYENVGLNLKITPMITKGNSVKLAIAQTTGDVLTRNSETPTTTERTIKTVVVVEDTDVLVLGGLISSKRENGESKIPIIGDIPILGNFFKRKVEGLSKKNLMVFIRPVIMRDSEQSHNVSVNKYDLMRDGQLLYKIDPTGSIAREQFTELPDMDPEFNQGRALQLPGPFAKDTIQDKIPDLTILK